jgi:hypothetical protein
MRGLLILQALESLMTDDPRIAALAGYTLEGALTPGHRDAYLFFVGRDDVHGLLKALLSQEKLALKLSMYSYDDDELNTIIMGLMKTPTTRVQISLDKSQSSGVHERKILALDETLNPVGYANSVVVCQSASHQILHTKGFVCVGQGIAVEGSTNWSTSGEGIGTGVKGATNVKAQSNTLLVTTNPVVVSRFCANLDSEHAVGLAQRAAT